MDSADDYAPLWEHIAELRSTLLRIFVVIGVSVVICFLNYDWILTFLESPLNPPHNVFHEERLEYRRLTNPSTTSITVPLAGHEIVTMDGAVQTSPDLYLIQPGGTLTYSKSLAVGPQLVLLGPLEGMLMALKTSFWVGTVGTSPLWLLFLMQFIMPGLRIREKRLAWSFLVTSIVLVSIGCLFAFYITIPIANQYLLTFNQSIGVNLWSLEHYLDYTLFLLLANGIAFELAAIGIFAVRLGFVSAETLVAYRRHAIVSAFILGALLTPPDVLTQLLLAFPLIGLYESLILYARITPSN